MHSHHLVSILIPVYNAAPYLRRALESALNQSHRNTEILCCDDGSSDGSLAELKKLADEYPQITVMANDTNRGVIETRNRLLNKANGDFIAWLDADDHIHPQKLEKQLAFLSQHPECGAVGTGVTYVDLQDNVYQQEYYSDNPSRQATDPEICCASVLVRREAARQAGGFRPIYHYGGEDGDWLLRIADFWELRNLPEPLYYYRKNPHSISHRYRPQIRRLGVIARAAAKQRRASGICPIDNGEARDLSDDYFLHSGRYTVAEQITATCFTLEPDAPMVSIIMPCYNHHDLTAEAILTLERQRYQNFELLIYDDGSHPPLADNVAFTAARDAVTFPIIIEASTGNHGPAYGRNRLLEKARGRFVMFHDADDLSEPARIEQLLQTLLTETDCIAVGSGVQFISADGTVIRHETYPRMAVSPFSFSGCCATFMYRFSEHHTLRFDESLKSASEDVDFLLRLSHYGKLYNNPQVLYKYRMRPDSLTAHDTWQSSHANYMLLYFARQNKLETLDDLPAFLSKVDGTQTGDLITAWIWRSWTAKGGSISAKMAGLLLFRKSLTRSIHRKITLRLQYLRSILRRIRNKFLSVARHLYHLLQHMARKLPQFRQLFVAHLARKTTSFRLTTVRIIDCWGDAEEAINMLLPANSRRWRSVMFTTRNSRFLKPDYYLVLNQPDRENVRIQAAPSRVLFAIGEPPTPPHRPMHDGQGAGTIVFTPDNHAAERVGNEQRRYIYTHCMTRSWSVKKNFDELVNIENDIVKSRKLSWITSNVALLPGHHHRLRFLEALQKEVPFDLFGRGFKPVADKWNALAPYEYSIAFENTIAPLYFTEKIMDCFVSMTVPLYYGSPDIGRYFPEKSFITIDPDDPKVFSKIRDVIENDDYTTRINVLREAKNLVLTKYNMFVYLAEWIEAQPRTHESPKNFKLKRHTIDWNASE